ECSNGENRGRGIGQHMDVGGTEIVVALMMVVIVIMVMIMRMRMSMSMMMIVLTTQQPGADQIDREAEAGHRNRLAIDDRDRRDQPQRALIGDLDRDDAKNQRAGERGEIAELAGAEGKPRVAQLPPGEQIGRAGNAERGGVGAHMPAV